MLRQQLADGRFAAAGHADQNQVPLLLFDRGNCRFNQGVGQILAGKQPRGRQRLSDQHCQPVAAEDALLLRLPQQRGLHRVVDEIKHRFQPVKAVKRNRGLQVVGIHTDRRRVD